ncbi:hypothetical protein THAOC_02355 [Thalassiosira oceanica]|uniref:Strawberry notch AAA domain-containing protein n=1 Tax=Thalassiosira oceanica TaxID=159749 RepID=K0TQE5_THAOC|nr:hypothetical protein THAOC_02355 [Thalassiosira oceanica]|eukprot:EJK75907.1 hypothetical protein THAOC_02355 [Thalassiosira oceanica]
MSVTGADVDVDGTCKKQKGKKARREPGRGRQPPPPPPPPPPPLPSSASGGRGRSPSGLALPSEFESVPPRLLDRVPGRGGAPLYRPCETTLLDVALPPTGVVLPRPAPPSLRSTGGRGGGRRDTGRLDLSNGGSDGLNERVKSENAEPNNVPTEAVEEEADEMTYAPYRPSKLRYGLAHPDPVVENATLAAVEPPDVTYNLALPADIIGEGRLSDLQVENENVKSENAEPNAPTTASRPGGTTTRSSSSVPPFRADGPPSIAILENSPAWSTRDVRLIPRAESSRDVSESRRLWVDLGPVCRICTKSSFPESSRRALQVTLNRRIQGRASGVGLALPPEDRIVPFPPASIPAPGGLGGERMTLHVDSTASRPSLIVLPPADCAIVV